LSINISMELFQSSGQYFDNMQREAKGIVQNAHNSDTSKCYKQYLLYQYVIYGIIIVHIYYIKIFALRMDASFRA
jgi:hypothetical protein